MGTGIFGLTSEYEDAEVIIIPVPWEVSVSYRTGTCDAPRAILAASSQIDLFQEQYPKSNELDFFMLDVDESLAKKGKELRQIVNTYIKQVEADEQSSQREQMADKLNEGCSGMVQKVGEKTEQILKDNKIPGVLGGDHSVALGNIQALANRAPFGVLQIDAHADLRKNYQALEYSHASVMYHVQRLEPIECIVQVSLRDYCEEERQRTRDSNGRIQAFYDESIKNRIFGGENWEAITNEIIGSLPPNVYISFDIDGLEPTLCPNTGTPVPGGLTWDMAMFLIRRLSESGKRIVGFDLCEVAIGNNNVDGWDAIVGARVLHKLCVAALVSRQG